MKRSKFTNVKDNLKIVHKTPKGIKCLKNKMQQRSALICKKMECSRI